jgi:hypothetical protein
VRCWTIRRWSKEFISLFHMLEVPQDSRQLDGRTKSLQEVFYVRPIGLL